MVRLIASVNLFALMLTASVTSAQAYDASDTYAAIDQASAETGVSWTWLHRVISCETGGTFSPGMVGDHGTSFGAAQLHRGGELGRFYATGYSDPMNPYQAVEFMALRFKAGGATAWTCR